MLTPITKFGLLLSGWLALFCAVLPDSPRVVHAQERPGVVDTSSPKQSARERWEALSPEQKHRYQKRFEELKKLDTKEREKLAGRAKKLKKAERRVIARLSERDRQRLMGQPEGKRKQLIAEMIVNEERSRGERIHDKLPRRVREWLADASPDERRTRLEAFKRTTREEISAKAVEELAVTLGYGPQEIGRFMALPMQERMSTVMRFRKQLSLQQLAQSDLSPEFSQQEWRDLDALPPEEYLAEIMRLRHEGKLSAPKGPVESPTSPAGSTSELSEITRELRRSMHRDPAERLELSELSAAERRAEMNLRRRQRVLQVIEKHEMCSDEGLKSIQALPDKEFFAEVRAWVSEQGKGSNAEQGSGRRPRMGRAGSSRGSGGRKGKPHGAQPGPQERVGKEASGDSRD